MKRIKDIIATTAMVALIMGGTALTASCSTDELAADGTQLADGQLKLSVNIPDKPSFDETSTRTIGTPDAGKTTWENGDQIQTQVYVYNSDKSKYVEICYRSIYNNDTWNMVDGTTYVYGYTNGGSYKDFVNDAFISADGVITLPVGYEDCTSTANVNLTYQIWTDTDNQNSTAGLYEYWQADNNDINITAGNIVQNFSSSDWKAATSRIRVRALPGDKVTLTGTYNGSNKYFGIYALPAGLISSYPADGCSSTVTADDNGNAFFYIQWTVDTKLLVSLNGKESTGSENEIVFAKTYTTTDFNNSNYSEYGTTYVIDALANASKAAWLTADASGTLTGDTEGKTCWVVSKASTTVTDDEVCTAVKSKLPANGTADGTIALVLTDINSIPNSAFYGCDALKSVSAPEVTSIGECAFAECRKQLTTVNFPKVTNIGLGAFGNCWVLTKVDFPKIEHIEANTFMNCNVLTNANIPNATSIEQGAFANCINLITAYFPKATSIGKQAFVNAFSSSGCKLTLGAVNTIDVTTDNHSFRYANTTNTDLIFTAKPTAGDYTAGSTTWAGMTWKSITVSAE